MRKDGSLRKARSAAKPLCWEAPGEQAHGHGRGQHRRGRAWQLGSRRAAEPGAVAAGRAWYGACGLRGLLIAGEGHGRGLRPGERCGSWCCGGEEGARASGRPSAASMVHHDQTTATARLSARSVSSSRPRDGPVPAARDRVRARRRCSPRRRARCDAIDKAPAAWDGDGDLKARRCEPGPAPRPESCSATCLGQF